MRYFIHPESSCAWAQPDDAPADFDELTEEVSRDEYLRALAAGYRDASR